MTDPDLLVDTALSLPGAVFINYSYDNSDGELWATYEIGIHQLRQHKRFANVMVFGETGALYFKHNPETIGEIYERSDGAVQASEISSKYWSKAFLDRDLDNGIMLECIRQSYRLVLESLPKNGQSHVEALKWPPYLFRAFHAAAIGFADNEDVYLQYTDAQDPSIAVQGKEIAFLNGDGIGLRVSPKILQLDGLEAEGGCTRIPDSASEGEITDLVSQAIRSRLK